MTGLRSGLPKPDVPCYDAAIMETTIDNRQPGPPHDPAGGAAAARPHTAWRRLARNLWGGGRLALLRRVTPDELCCTPADLALLAVADLLLNLLVSFLLVGPDGEFAYQAIPSFFFHLPLVLLLGALAARRLERPALVTAIPVALIALSLVLELSHGLLEGLAQLPGLERLDDWLEESHYYRFFWWWLAAGALFLGRLAPAVSRRLPVLLGFLALVVAPLWLFPRGDLWLGADEGAEGGQLHLTGTVLATQQQLLDRTLDRLLPGRPGVPHLYFVGFAGDASQDVFTRELTAVGRLFAERFGTAGRTVLLANNPRTATTLPFATGANLERTLARVGRVMNRDDDLLFLYLTSHGSPDHELAVDNPPLELGGLTPARLRAMLRQSGITWKIIVVSSCYAGGFVAPLADDHTLVITAADADSASFGCSYGEQFTWFGKAYFDEALRRTFSFTGAFAAARQTIRQWERQEGETPSNPQIAVGAAMARPLLRLENRLKNEGATAAPGRNGRASWPQRSLAE